MSRCAASIGKAGKSSLRLRPRPDPLNEVSIIAIIRLVAIRPAGDAELDLVFSDGATGRWSAMPLIERDTELTRRLGEPTYFRRAFLEAGALCWPNGLDLSAHALHRKLDEDGKLVRDAA